MNAPYRHGGGDNEPPFMKTLRALDASIERNTRRYQRLTIINMIVFASYTAFWGFVAIERWVLR